MANSPDLLEFISRGECNQIITKYLNSSDFELKDYPVECVNDVDVIGYIGEYYWLLIDVKVVGICYQQICSEIDEWAGWAFMNKSTL